MITSNPLNLLHLSFLMMDDYVQSIEFFTFIAFDDGRLRSIHYVLCIYLFWWWMVTFNPLRFLHLSFLMMDDYVQSIKFFAFIVFDGYVQSIKFSQSSFLCMYIYIFIGLARWTNLCYIWRAIDSSNLHICLFVWQCQTVTHILHSTILAMLLTQAPSLISTLLFEV